MNYKKILYLVLTAIFFVACENYPVPENVSPENNFQGPDSIAPTYALEDSLLQGWEVKTIEEFQAMVDTGKDPEPFQIRKKYLLKGVISADDESGNLYKKLYVQDETAGIELAIDQVNLYNIMPRGQEVIIEMKDMWIGKYREAFQVGDSTYNYKYGFQMSRYDWTRELKNKHFYSVGRPDLSKIPAPIKINSSGEILDVYYGMLVTLENVTLPEADGVRAKWSFKEENTNRTVMFQDSTSIIVRTSGYSNFYTDLMPQGVGSITGIVTTYAGTVQLYLRDRNDIGKFTYTEH